MFQQPNPFNTLALHSVEDVDNAARFLSEQWERSFSPAPKLDGKKKAKLRDMVCNLAGFTNGFKSFLDHISVPYIDKDAFSLPDELMVNFDPDFDFMYVGTDTTRMTHRGQSPESLFEDSEDCIGVVYHDDAAYGEMESGHAILGNNKPIMDVDLWRYLVNHYDAAMIQVTLPRIDKYGLPEMASEAGVRTYLAAIGILMSEIEIANALHVEDRGDDGGMSLSIHWVRKGTEV
jgi:hypothetical protein